MFESYFKLSQHGTDIRTELTAGILGLTDINWDDTNDFGPAVVTVISMPLAFSISNGIGLGFISYTAMKLLSGDFRDVREILNLLGNSCEIL